MKSEFFNKFIKPCLWRLVLTILGLMTAISFIMLGFGKTMLIITCCSVGYFIGIIHDKNINLLERIRYWRNRW